MRRAAATSLLFAAALAAGPARAQFEATPMAVVRPGGGILVADGVSILGQSVHRLAKMDL